MKTQTKTLAAAVSLLVISCTKNECNNTNPVFETSTPESAEYKTELVKVLTDNDAEFTLASYSEEGAIPQLEIDITGESFCAKATVTVLVPDEYSKKLIDTKGMGYNNASLNNLKFRLDKRTNTFIYEGMSRITD